jgi:hypothetical protein
VALALPTSTFPNLGTKHQKPASLMPRRITYERPQPLTRRILSQENTTFLSCAPLVISPPRKPCLSCTVYTFCFIRWTWFAINLGSNQSSNNITQIHSNIKAPHKKLIDSTLYTIISKYQKKLNQSDPEFVNEILQYIIRIKSK